MLHACMLKHVLVVFVAHLFCMVPFLSKPKLAFVSLVTRTYWSRWIWQSLNNLDNNIDIQDVVLVSECLNTFIICLAYYWMARPRGERGGGGVPVDPEYAIICQTHVTKMQIMRGPQCS